MPGTDGTPLYELQQIYPSSLELSKNSRGFTWSIKLRCVDGKEDDMIERIRALNAKMEASFPDVK